jgi:inward rectifier potassium channel
MLRLANIRDTHIVDASINVAVLLPYVSKEGYKIKRFYTLPLLRNNSPAFALTWTVMHQITKTSPLYNLSFEDIKELGALFFVSFTGIDDVLSQNIHANHRYVTDSFFKAKQFADILNSEDNSTYTLDFTRFHEIEGY